MKKSLLVIAILVVACGMSSAVTFGFESTGHSLYCNYEVLSVYGGTVWQGDDILTACGASYNATVAGIAGKLAKTGNPAGFAVSGVTYADNIYDAFSLGYTGAQWDVTSNLKCSEKKYGWIGFASVSSFIFGDNYGYLSCNIPGKGASPSKGLSIGNAKAPARR